MALRWRTSFSCNIKEIDAQHRKLFEISSKLNILEPICARIDYRDEILEVVRELREYTIYHFEYEERLLERYGYENLAVHHFEHEAFVATVLELESNSVEYTKPEMIREITDFITAWITRHILKTDMNYKEFLNQKGVY